MSTVTQSGSFSASADYDSPPFEILGPSSGVVQIRWDLLDNYDATCVIQVCFDPNLGWNDIFADINKVTLDTQSDTQIWELLEITGKYIRLHYEHGSVTTGSIAFRFLASTR